jgi:2'-5' RNA ligase
MQQGKEQVQAGVKMYFIAVVLPAHLNEKVLAWKHRMQETYGCNVGLKSPAHITIAPPFWMEEEKEPALTNDMLRLARDVPAFTLATDGFSAFRPRTIFVAVQESRALQALKKAADSFFRPSDYKMKLENRPFHPHITIATRDLHKKDFAEAWPFFQQQEFRETFAATGLSLLKHNGRMWDVVFTAPFAAPSPTDVATQP